MIVWAAILATVLALLDLSPAQSRSLFSSHLVGEFTWDKTLHNITLIILQIHHVDTSRSTPKGKDDTMYCVWHLSLERLTFYLNCLLFSTSPLAKESLTNIPIACTRDWESSHSSATTDQHRQVTSFRQEPRNQIIRAHLERSLGSTSWYKCIRRCRQDVRVSFLVITTIARMVPWCDFWLLFHLVQVTCHEHEKKMLMYAHRFVFSPTTEVDKRLTKETSGLKSDVENLGKKLQYLETTYKNSREHMEQIFKSRSWWNIWSEGLKRRITSVMAVCRMWFGCDDVDGMWMGGGRRCRCAHDTLTRVEATITPWSKEHMTSTLSMCRMERTDVGHNMVATHKLFNHDFTSDTVHFKKTYLEPSFRLTPRSDFYYFTSHLTFFFLTIMWIRFCYSISISSSRKHSLFSCSWLSYDRFSVRRLHIPCHPCQQIASFSFLLYVQHTCCHRCSHPSVITCRLIVWCTLLLCEQIWIICFLLCWNPQSKCIIRAIARAERSNIHLASDSNAIG